MTRESAASGIAPQAPSTETGTGPARYVVKKVLLDKRLLPPALITFIVLVGHFSFGILEGYDKILIAIATCVSTELLLGRIFVGKWPNLSSAYVSGNSVGFLVRSTLYWPFIVCGALSIMSKYVLRYRDRHIWNPSNFGVSAMFFLAPFAVAPLSIQWGNDIWPILVIWTVGIIIIARLKRFHICASYAVGFFAFAAVRAWLTGTPVVVQLAPITGAMYQLFVLFMITDPRTTVRSRKGRMLVAFLIAFVEMFFRLGEVVYAPFYALFAVGPVAMIIEAEMEKRSLRARVAGVPEA